jgi:hypothetical protein
MGLSKVVFCSNICTCKKLLVRACHACDVISTAVTGFIKFVTVAKKALSKRRFHQQTSIKQVKKSLLVCMG